SAVMFQLIVHSLHFCCQFPQSFSGSIKCSLLAQEFEVLRRLDHKLGSEICGEAFEAMSGTRQGLCVAGVESGLNFLEQGGCIFREKARELTEQVHIVSKSFESRVDIDDTVARRTFEWPLRFQPFKKHRRWFSVRILRDRLAQC